MKIAIYALLFAQTAIIIYLTNVMVNRPFNTDNMRSANYYGCTMGQFWVKSTKFTCSESADNFKKELNRLDALDDMSE